MEEGIATGLFAMLFVLALVAGGIFILYLVIRAAAGGGVRDVRRSRPQYRQSGRDERFDNIVP